MELQGFKRGSGEPLYKQLKEYIRTWIESNRLQPGDKIPTERELARLLGVSRLTVRQAIAELVREGILYRVQGSGTYVAEAEATTLRVVVPEREWIPYLLQAESRYNELHEREPIRLEIEVVGRPKLRERIVSAVGAGEAPDIALIDLVWVAEFAALRYFYPLNEIDGEWIDSYLDDLLPGVKNGISFGGKVYGVQVDLSVSVLWYRRDLLREAGLEPPSDWDELSGVATELKGKTGKAPLAFCGGTRGGEATSYQLLPLFWSAGADLVRNGRAAVDERWIRPLEFLRGLVEEGLTPVEVTRLPWDGPRKALARGEVALSFGGTYEKRGIQAAAKLGEVDFRERFGMVTIPKAPGGRHAATVGGMVFSVSRQSGSPEACMGLLEELASPALMAGFCSRTGRIPSRSSVAEELAERNWYLREEMAILPYARARPVDPHYAKLSFQFRLTVEEVLMGKLSPGEAVRKARAGIEAILQG